jgi:putative tricarboxylic transport membrane protein
VTKADRVTAALLLALAVAFSAGALTFYPYSSEGGPGSGFLPFWLGLAMAGLALLLLVRRPRAADAGVDWAPRGEARNRVLIVGLVTLAFVALLDVLGMIVGTALYLTVLIRFLGRHRWWVTLLVAAGAAGFNWLVFAHWLRVPFPEGMLWIF